MNPRQMKAMMKKMGISTEEIDDIEEIIIRTKTKDLVFKDASVTMMSIQGQKTFQLVGEPEIREKKSVEEELLSDDIALVMEQAGVSEEEARRALKECNGQPAEAILKLMSAG